MEGLTPIQQARAAAVQALARVFEQRYQWRQLSGNDVYREADELTRYILHGDPDGIPERPPRPPDPGVTLRGA